MSSLYDHRCFRDTSTSKIRFSCLHFIFYGRKNTNFVLAVDCGDDDDGGGDAVNQR